MFYFLLHLIFILDLVNFSHFTPTLLIHEPFAQIIEKNIECTKSITLLALMRYMFHALGALKPDVPRALFALTSDVSRALRFSVPDMPCALSAFCPTCSLASLISYLKCSYAPCSSLNSGASYLTCFRASYIL